jgi:ribosomal protein L7/L12
MTDVQWATLRPILQDLTDRIARIEQFLAASGMQARSSEFSDATGFAVQDGPSLGQAAASAHGVNVGGPAVGASGQMPDYIVQMARSGQLIQAIKELRDITGISLKDAKAAVEQAARGY